MTRNLKISLLCASLSVAVPRSVATVPATPAPDLALSAAFAPPEFVVRDAGHRARIREYLSRLDRDSSQTFSLKGNTLRLSPRMARRLAAGEGVEAGDGRVRGNLRVHGRQRTQRYLERMTGAGLEEVGIAYAAGYLPEEASMVYNAPSEEEPVARCREKPLWALHNTGLLCGSVPGLDINIAKVWERFDGADTLVIAVLDAGLNFLHPELQGRWYVNQAEANGLPGVDDDLNGFVDDIRGWDFVDGDNDPQDYQGHGTMISGVIAAGFDNGTGIAGVLPRVRILPVRVLSTAGFGNTNNIANGVRYAAAMGAHVINFSIGVPGSEASPALRNAFVAARDSGVIVVAASANNGINLDTTSRQPGSYGFDNVYMVASHTASGELAGHSNFGATTVDLAAPGSNIVTTTIPPAIVTAQEGFENFAPARWNFTGGSYQVAPDSMEGAASLRWVSGNTATATLNDTIDLRGLRGGLLRFRLHFEPAHDSDGVYIDVKRVGTATWTQVGGYGGSVIEGQSIAINLGPLDDTRFQVRFQTCALGEFQTCTGSTVGRVLRIDDVRVTRADLNPQNQNRLIVTGGTSLAAPYVAAYAGLMRLATDRTGLPLTRQRMLAGITAEPALAGKLTTGGRLNAAKGLDFYLQTLPRIHVTDALDTNWKPGAPVAYALSVSDPGGPRNDFTFSTVSSPVGGTLSPGGLFAWNSDGATEGTYVLRAKAESGDDILRAMVTFTVGSPLPVVAALPGSESHLRIGSRSFLLPFTALDRGQHVLRIEFFGADGRTLRTVTGKLAIQPGARNAEYALTGFHGVGVRAWLNGTPLRPAPRD